MSDATQPPLALGKPHHNQYLFSDHYLEEIVRRGDAWRAAVEPARAFLAWLRELYAAEGGQLAAYSEAQLEERWFRPILAQLGHVWESQAAVPGLEKTIKKPDYVFFPDDTTRKAVVGDQRTEEYARRALAVGEVKAWPVHLSKKAAGRSIFDNNNPMFQIDYYLKATGAAWGIVSNGRFWRLVHRDTSYKLDVYFEVDLGEALTAVKESDALAVAAYFLVFFRGAAFRPDERGVRFLDEVLAGSRDYAVALESDLRDNAYKALEQLIIGFFAPAANRLDAENEDDRRAVYRNSLLLLYRLLFLFYGESRGLLPMREDAYRARSLTELARAGARLVDDHKMDTLPPMTGQHWARLRELFAIIDGGDAALNAFLGVPRYNGGLFDPRRHAFLEEKFVGDRHLVRAIDYLARRRKTEGGRDKGYETVDYRTMGVRQLGSIYEGLLEYRVSRATEPMVTVRKGGKETWLPARERGKAQSIETRAPGELYLATDKGERKATGSYYTPDYIVKYIVEQTLGPLVERVREEAGAYAKTQSSQGKEGKRQLEARYFEEGVLALNVLDPAMGSGHFLVDATDFLARALATSDLTRAVDDDAFNASSDASVSSVKSVDSSSSSDLTYWRRRVVEACIYGVDKNELAVELAKLSLWLVTVAADKPLSFLDHHLRHGDSLIGARLKELEVAPGKKAGGRGSRGAGEPQSEPLFDESAFTTSVGLAVHGMAAIEARPTDDLDTVHAKEDAWHIIHDTHLARWRQLANLWVSAHFGNAMSAGEYADLARRIQGRPADMKDEQAARYLAHPAAADNDYFHWEIEFPEVFFDAYGRPKGAGAGFDAVIGNPPYENAWSMTSLDSKTREAIESLSPNPSLLSGHWDLYAAFVIQSLRLTRTSASHAFIVPDALTREKYANHLREHLLTEKTLTSIMHFEGVNVFDEVSRHCIIYNLRNQAPSKNSVTRIHIPLAAGGNAVEEYGIVAQSSWLGLKDYQIRLQLADERVKSIIRKLTSSECIQLGQFCYVMVGATTHSKEPGAFTKSDIIGYSPKGNAKRFFDGKNLSRYHVQWDGRYIDYRNAEMYGPRVSALFESPKVLVRDVTGANEQLIVSYDDEGLYCDHLVTCVTYYENVENTVAQTSFEDYPRIQPPYPSLLYVTGVLASKLMTWYFREVFATGTLQGSYSHTYPQQVRAFPIPKASSSLNDNSESEDGFLEELPSLLARHQVESVLTQVNTLLLEDDVNTVHDVLAYLADQMLTMHREKQSLTTDFWTDLEGVTAPAAFRKLRDKGKQEAGLWAEAALRPFVRQTSKRSRALDESLAWDEAAFKAFVRALAGPVEGLSGLVKVYAGYAPRYRELTGRLARTDRLIDQIVYRLYGLTEEEVAVVEGRGSKQ